MSHRLFRLLVAAVLAMSGLAIATVAAPPASAAGPTPASITLTTSPNPSSVVPPQTVTLTATVTGSGAVPTGDVTFKEGMVVLGIAALDGTGTATWTTTFTADEHLITAEYEGDTTYTTATVTRTHVAEAMVTRKTWVGPADGLWSVDANWNPANAPDAGDTLIFGDAGAGASSDNDIAGLTLDHISFTRAHEITGLAFTLDGTVTTVPGAAGAITAPITLATGTHTVDGDVVIGGQASGAGGFKKTGPGTLTLSNAANDYTGATEVAAGVVSAVPGALGAASSGTTVTAGATLRSTGAGTNAEPLTLAGDGTSATSGALDVQSPATFSGAVSLSGTRVTVSSVDSTISGVITGADKTLRKTGAGVLTLTAANTLGGVEVAAGTLVAGAGGALGSNAVTLADATTLSFTGPGTGTLVFPNAITTGAGSTIGATGAGTIGLTGAVAVGGATALDADTRINVAGVLSGAGPLTVQGDADVLFTGTSANTGTGLLTVDGGEAWAGKDGAVSVPAGATVSNGGLLAWLDDNQVADSAAVTVGTGSTMDMFGSSDVIGSLTSAGDVFLGLLDSGGNDFSLLEAGALSLTGGTLNLAVSDAGSDKIKASSVSLAGVLALSGDLPFGTTVTLIDNTGGAPVTGTFAGLAEGATVTLDTASGVISYKGGDGNDVTLTTRLTRSGYWMVDAKGKVYPFGDAKHFGEPSAILPAGATAVDIEPATDFNGYWVLSDKGGVYAYGSAPSKTLSGAGLGAGEKATSISNDGKNNYWVFTDKGRALTYGSAGHFKDMAGTPLNGPVLGSVGTPTGLGYFMVASDGGIFAFGDAKYRGSMGGQPLNGPVVGLAPDPDGDGYWLVGSDGGIFSFLANFKLSMGGKPLNKPMIGMVAYGDGYLMVASDGGIFNFSSKPFKGSLGGQAIPQPITSVAPLNEV